MECSILKVWGSEMLDMVVDHVLQIYAGYGYVEEYPAERAYRDSRINRIFEGTNEINRLIITGWLMKRAVAGPVAAPGGDQATDGRGDVRPQRRRRSARVRLAAEHKMLASAKKLALFAAGAASQKYSQGLGGAAGNHGRAGRLHHGSLRAGSCLLRAEKLIAAKGEAAAKQAIAMTQYYAVKVAADGGTGRPQSDRSGRRRRHAADPGGDPAAAGQVRAGRYHRAGPADRPPRARGGTVRAVGRGRAAGSH